MVSMSAHRTVFAISILLCTCICVLCARELAGTRHDRLSGSWNATVTVDLGRRHPISPTLFGIFFEEIGHAGDGGMYAELVQDRSFDALAYASGFHSGTEPGDSQEIDLSALAHSHPNAWEPLHVASRWDASSPVVTGSKDAFVASHMNADSTNDVIVAWQALSGTKTVLSRQAPLNPHNLVSMTISASQNGKNGIVNHGYWGLHIERDQEYELSLYGKAVMVGPMELTAELMDRDLNKTYARARLGSVGDDWEQKTVTLTATESSTSAVLVISFRGPGTVALDVVSLFPAENVRKAAELGDVNPWPFRHDLLGALKALQPGFMRFPGGCYVEGDRLANRFYWKESIGPISERPGHLNGPWRYWSTDGLGLYEYMLLAEELDTEPVWVINNGVAHADSVAGADIWPYVQDALDSLEFVMGSASSEWGSRRAAMGRSAPFRPIKYMAIGNEDCGKPYYLNNYLVFFGALRAKHPTLRLISNCDMGAGAPTDLWDWHLYTNPRDLFDRRRVFDGRDPGKGHLVFASEYAVTAGGGWGNLIGAVAEAAFMTGLERNGQAVVMGSYAPLFVHTNDRPWPTNMIVIDNARFFGIPSYHVQKLFRETQGVYYAATDAATGPAYSLHEETVAASLTCQNPDCATMVLKIVNLSSYMQTVRVELRGLAAGASIRPDAKLVYLTSGHPEDENTFEEPFKVSPKTERVSGVGRAFDVTARPYSVNWLTLESATQPDAVSTA